ncbi:MAG: hypothetical protein ACREQE_10750 [Candidatus Binataceae bacterium]
MIIDKNLEVLARWDARTRERIRGLINDELIEEYRRNPFGHHSAALERVLVYFRQTPTKGKYVLVRMRPDLKFRIATLSGARGAPPNFVDKRTFDAEGEAHHAVFMLRIDELMRQ